MQIKLLRANARLPVRATGGSAGYDLCACTEEPLCLKPGERALLPSGIAVAVPEGCALLIFARSGLAVKHGIVPANCVGVVDSDYRGEIMVGLVNQSKEEYTISPGERIAQMLLVPVLTPELEAVDELTETERGAGGFGSTGRV
ncbi:MAG: dUTP diphosphatase [Clostridium sp.]|jgi:dUTP pyrophosphatase|nr:dUTP diphosphatase [Clostridium sp.]